MSIAKQIQNCRAHLNSGNSGAYARGMSGHIRASRSGRAAKAFRDAIAADGAEALFSHLDTDCPLAKDTREEMFARYHAKLAELSRR